MKITKLDGLRGVFCLIVAAYHFSAEYLPHNIHGFFLLRQCWPIVDFFFVLSGFVIAMNYPHFENKSFFFLYLKKRFVKVYPLLIFTVLIFFFFKILASLILPESIDFLEPFSEDIYSVFNSLLMLNSTPLLYSKGMNYPSWSVSAEVISYAVYGLLTLYSFHKKKIVISVLLILTSIIFLSSEEILYENYSFLRGLVGFLIGKITYIIYSQKKIKISNLFEYITLIIVILIIYIIHNSQYNMTLKITAPFFCGFIMFILIHTNGLISRLLESNPFQFLGKISYSIYLNHALFIMGVPRLIFREFGLNITPINQIIVFILSLTLIVLYSTITHKYIEIRGGNFLRKLLIK